MFFAAISKTVDSYYLGTQDEHRMALILQGIARGVFGNLGVVDDAARCERAGSDLRTVAVAVPLRRELACAAIPCSHQTPHPHVHTCFKFSLKVKLSKASALSTTT